MENFFRRLLLEEVIPETKIDMITQETLHVEREIELLKICDMCELNEYTKKFEKIYIKASKSIKNGIHQNKIKNY